MWGKRKNLERYFLSMKAGEVRVKKGKGLLYGLRQMGCDGGKAGRTAEFESLVSGRPKPRMGRPGPGNCKTELVKAGKTRASIGGRVK